jgi:hypothetical protein
MATVSSLYVYPVKVTACRDKVFQCLACIALLTASKLESFQSSRAAGASKSRARKSPPQVRSLFAEVFHLPQTICPRLVSVDSSFLLDQIVQTPCSFDGRLRLRQKLDDCEGRRKGCISFLDTAGSPDHGVDRTFAAARGLEGQCMGRAASGGGPGAESSWHGFHSGHRTLCAA